MTPTPTDAEGQIGRGDICAKSAQKSGSSPACEGRPINPKDAELIERLRNAAGHFCRARESGITEHLAGWEPRVIDEAADRITSLSAQIEELRAHIAEQTAHARTRIQDGHELGATVWRLALEDIIRENTTLGAQP